MASPLGARGLLLSLSAAAIALFGAICGIGGGLFAVPLFHYVYGLELRRSVATSLCLVLATALGSSVAEALHAESALRLSLVAPLVVGALVGAQFGFFVSKRISPRVLRVVFAVVMTAAGLRLALSGGSAGGPGVGGLEIGAAEVAATLGVGLVAGTVAPLLGIGGGLVVVPGVLLFVPDAGMLGARAASLAVAIFTALRSLQLYRREGAIDGSLAPWIMAGALVGAVVGVQLVHLEGVAAFGRVALGGLLLFTGGRFALDVLRGRAD